MLEIIPAAAALMITVAYGAGVRRLWRRGGHGRAIKVRQVVSFGLAVAIGLAIAGGPFDEAAHERISAHMAQHALLIGCVAPLAAAGNPVLAVISVAPASLTRSMSRLSIGIRRGVRRITVANWIAAISLVIAVWAWHLPRLYDAAQSSEGLHATEHVMLTGVAFTFWHGVLRDGRSRGSGQVRAIGRLGLVMLTTMPLGVFITFADVSLYASHGETIGGSGGGVVADQRLGGLVMLMAMGVVYVAVMISLLWKMLATLEAVDRDRPTGEPPEKEKPPYGGGLPLCGLVEPRGTEARTSVDNFRIK